MKYVKLLHLFFVLSSFIYSQTIQACDTSPIITTPEITDLGNGNYELEIKVCVGLGGSNAGWSTSFDSLDIISFNPPELINGTNVATGSLSGDTLIYNFPGPDSFIGSDLPCHTYSVVVNGDPVGEIATFNGVNCGLGVCNEGCNLLGAPISLMTISAPLSCGDAFYDPGGSNDGFLNGTLSTTVICPDVPGDVVTVDFTSFDLVDTDYYCYYWGYCSSLTIYDGECGRGDPIIGTYQDLDSPGTVMATGITGCLTFSLYSSPFVTIDEVTGWEASVISCASLCGYNAGAVVSDVSCSGGSDGVILIETTGSGGMPPYTYTWDNGLSTTNTQDGLSAGIYSITVSDANNCEDIINVTISEPNVLIIGQYYTAPALCGDHNGTAYVEPFGGVSPYTYAWNTVPVQTTQLATNLPGGTYTVTITDANLCELAVDLIVEEDLPLLVSMSSTPATSPNNGTATATVSGGTAPYAYTWDTAGNFGSTATGLAPGIYAVTITDANNCTTSGIVTVDNLTAVNDLKSLTEFTITPNPNNGRFMVEIVFSAYENVKVSLMNTLGQELYETNFSGTNKEIPLNISDRAAGVYFVVLTTEKGQTSKKVVLLK